MKDWRDYCKLGIVHPQLFPQCAAGKDSVLETLTLMVEDGFFNALEITSIADPGIRRKSRDLLENNQIHTIFCCAPPILMQGINLNELDEKKRASHISSMKRYLDEAVFMGAEIFTLLSGPDPGAEKREAGTKALLLSLEELCNYAATLDRNLMLTLETFDRDVDKKRLIGPTVEAVMISQALRGLGCDNFGLTLDQAHLPLLNENAEEAIAEALPYLYHLHLGNCIKCDPDHPLYGDHHPRFGLSQCHLELNDLVSFLHALDRLDFWSGNGDEGQKPVLSFEVKPAMGESSRDTLEKTKETWQKAWEKFASG